LLKIEFLRTEPRWWKPYWIVLVVAAILVSVILVPLLLNVSLEDAAISVVMSLLCIGFAYYIRVRPSIRINRAMYVFVGIVSIGFLLWAAIMLLLKAGGILTLIRSSSFGGLIDIVIGSLFVGSYVAGAFIGDWIGKKLNYRIILTID
jgi:hypothetical protein